MEPVSMIPLDPARIADKSFEFSIKFPASVPIAFAGVLAYMVYKKKISL